MTQLNLKDIHTGITRVLYRGVATQKFPFDYVMYQMIIQEVQPDLIIEIGTMHGGSALYFADLLEIMNIEGGEVHTIDWLDPSARKEHEATVIDEQPNPNENPNYPDIVKSHPRIKTFLGGFQDYDLNNCKGFKKILVIDDGSHIYSEVLDSMNKFKDIISVDSYLIIEDGNCEEVCNNRGDLIKMWGGGPLPAIYKFLSENDNFRIDQRWCDMFGINSTYNTYGYLKKIK